MSCSSTMRSSPKRRRSKGRDGGRDRLSEMPDDVIIRVLSFLPTLDAVRTVLLRRFGNLWTLVPTLNFNILEFFHMEHSYWDARKEPNDAGRFYLFGRNVLILHKRHSIDRMCLHIDSCYDDGSIPMWLRFALDRQTKEIKYRDESSNCDRTFLPSLTSQYLVTLELSNCRLDAQHKVNLGSLKKLLLEYVAMCEDALQRLLSGCPSLQELDITYPDGLSELTFSAPNIQTLYLELHLEFNSWKLDLPNLKSLDFNVDGVEDIIDVSSIREVCIRCHMIELDEEEYAGFKKYFIKFKEAETFKLNRYACKLFLHFVDDLDLLQIRWRFVILELSRFCEDCLGGICVLLRRLKHLEELILRSSLKGAEELEFVKRVASFRRRSKNASVVFAPLKRIIHPSQLFTV